MITRREFIGTLAGGLLAEPRASEAQQAAKVARIGYLEYVDAGGLMSYGANIADLAPSPATCPSSSRRSSIW